MKRFYTFLFMLVAASATAVAEEEKVFVPQAVDLGLPSGTLWATCNIGASLPEAYGEYYFWGEMEPPYTKYTVPDGCTEEDWYDSEGNFIGDNKTILEPDDDSATKAWGQEWIMPSKEQFQELINNCYWVWTNGYNGTEVKGYIAYKANAAKPDDKGVRIHQGATPDEYYTLSIPHIFFPAAGSYIFLSEDENKIQSEGLLCNYWSASLGETNSNYAKYMVAGRALYDLHIVNEVERKPYGCFGYSVRAIKAKNFKITLTQPTENGTIRLLEDETVDLNDDVRERTVLHFVAEPAENYEIDTWSGCSEDGYLIVTGDATVTCTFKPKAATSVKSIKTSDSKVQKVVENGTLYIIKDGEKYNLQGVRKAE